MGKAQPLVFRARCELVNIQSVGSRRYISGVIDSVLQSRVRVMRPRPIESWHRTLVLKVPIQNFFNQSDVGDYLCGS